ncbi:ubiquitin conjugating [Stylonychia lemnae]|uniref:Ubiquitin conjugating n=1 Tax=Stylonychia lemnae TaxID=5949 RepID=A0A077ZT64_STYLE|nr:ubiquitin conjugating [Stylonychia lemnae]|eukprot:CDW72754.1 ubiquitin conjugating [Stylonychia lemnae]
MDSRNYALQVLRKQLKDIQQNDEIGCSVGLEDESDYFKWNIVFEGPGDTLYEGGFFKATLKFPSDYPNSPPEMRFVTKMWHPNIYPDGKVCISILHPPGTDEYNNQETADERWRPILGVESIILSVISMLNDPNISSPANIDAAVEYRDNYDSYKKKVRKLTIQSVESL